MILWRISRRKTLDGIGGLLASARWHTKGHRVVYLAETPAGAVTEVLVHLEVDPLNPPNGLKLLKVATVPVPKVTTGAVPIENVEVSVLPADWKEDKTVTRSIGDEWLASLRSPLLRVPSVIVRETFNVLLNPEHPDAPSIVILWADDFSFDDRLL